MREALAALAHEMWSGWMHYLFSKSTRNPDGSITIPLSSAVRWFRQMHTPYSNLPESEKESDRDQADKILAILEEAE